MPRHFTSNHQSRLAPRRWTTIAVNAALVPLLSLPLGLEGCEAQLPPARVPGIDLQQFTVEHPTNHVMFPVNPEPPPTAPPLSTAQDDEAAQATFEVLSTDAADGVVLMSYETSLGPVTGATAFGCSLSNVDTPLLCTTHRVFGPTAGLEDVIPQTALADVIARGFGRGRTSAPVFATVGDPLPILKTGVVTPGNVRDDILAFKLLPPSRIHPLSLSARPPTSGDRVRVVVLEATGRAPKEASTQDVSVELEVRELHARVVDANAEILIYAFEADLPAPHSRGAPVLDTAGKVIGVHVSIATDAGVTYGAAAPATSLIEGITSTGTP